MKKHNIAILLSVLLLPVLLYARTEERFDRTLQVSGSVTLDVTTGSGDITVRTGGANQVTVHGTVHGNNQWFSNADAAVHRVAGTPPIQQNGNSIRIGYDLPEDVRRHVSIDYEITLPADSSVEGHSGSGNVTVEGVRREVRGNTGSGDVKLRDIGGQVHAQTGSGNINAEGVGAPFFAQTGSGDIDAQIQGSGDAEVQTGSGTIRLRGIKGGLRARTGSGGITADGQVTNSWRLNSGSGDIRMNLGSSGGFNLDVHTSSGSIHSDLPITVQGSMGGHELKGTVRGGGPTVEVSTGSGDVEIK